MPLTLTWGTGSSAWTWSPRFPGTAARVHAIMLGRLTAISYRLPVPTHARGHARPAGEVTNRDRHGSDKAEVSVAE
jgi:hypothetical protein